MQSSRGLEAESCAGILIRSFARKPCTKSLKIASELEVQPVIIGVQTLFANFERELYLVRTLP